MAPNAAITANRESGTYTANLVVGEEDGLPITEAVEVLVGSKDDAFTHVVSGLSEGDEVLIGSITAPTLDFSSGSGNPFQGS